jgi:hypothetical protein
MAAAMPPFGQDRRAQLKEQLGRPDMRPDHPLFDRAKYDALEAEDRGVIGR